VVGRLGLEPRTHGLKVRCSTIELTPRLERLSDLLFYWLLVVRGRMLTGHRDADFWSGDDLNCPPAVMEAGARRSQQGPYLDSVKRLEAYLAKEDMPLAAPIIRGFLAAAGRPLAGCCVDG
jgi:hypothetical protein